MKQFFKNIIFVKEQEERVTVVSYLIESECFIKMRATFLALSFLHNSREDRGKKGSSHFGENLSI